MVPEDAICILGACFNHSSELLLLTSDLVICIPTGMYTFKQPCYLNLVLEKQGKRALMTSVVETIPSWGCTPSYNWLPPVTNFSINPYLNLNGARAMCGSDEIYECIRPIYDKYNIDLTKQSIFRMGLIFKVELVHEFCSDIDMLHDCVAESKICDERGVILERNSQTFLKASHHLCDQTTRRRTIDYRIIFNCFSRSSVKYYIDRCNQYMMQNLRNLSHFFSRFELSNSHNQLPIIIGFYNEKLGAMEDCLYHLIDDACGNEVATWYREYLLHMVEPLWNYFSSRYYVKYVYTYLLLSLAIICSFIIYLFFKNYKSHFEEKLNYASDVNINVPDTTRLLRTGFKQQLTQVLSHTGPKMDIQSPSDTTLDTHRQEPSSIYYTD